jgi:hypothetical protein
VTAPKLMVFQGHLEVSDIEFGFLEETVRFAELRFLRSGA